MNALFGSVAGVLANTLRTAKLSIPRPCASQTDALEEAARRAMAAHPGSMTLTERMSNPQRYAQIQTARRENLQALNLVRPTKAAAERAADLIGAILEEPDWSANATEELYPDEKHPTLDFKAAETAVLLAWTLRVYATPLAEISSRLIEKTEQEIRRRLLLPAAELQDYAFKRGEEPYTMVICADIIMVIKLLAKEESYTIKLLRTVLEVMDNKVRGCVRTLAPLHERVTNIAAATDLAVFLRESTDGRADLTRNIPTYAWLDEIIFSWIEGQSFIDPAGSRDLPAVSGSDIFHIGKIGNDGDIVALGAQTFKAVPVLPETVYGRMRHYSEVDEMSKVRNRPTRVHSGAMQDNALMFSRTPSLYAALHIGGGRANAGDVMICVNDRPLVVGPNLPLFDGMEQNAVTRADMNPEFKPSEPRDTMSVELQPAYSRTVCLSSFRRTVMTLQNDNAVQLIDAMQLDTPREICFRFVFTEKPILVGETLRFAGLSMKWDGRLTVNIRAMDNEHWLVEMRTPGPVRNKIFGFRFEG